MSYLSTSDCGERQLFEDVYGLVDVEHCAAGGHVVEVFYCIQLPIGIVRTGIIYQTNLEQERHT